MTQSAPRPVYFDLTEVLMASSGKLRYYGIVRVVAEVAKELTKIAPEVRFCVHSASHNSFFEVKPHTAADGSFDFDVPVGLKPLRLRKRFYKPNAVRDVIANGIRWFIYRKNRKNWEKRGVNLPAIDMSNAVYITFARPKLIVEAIETLRTTATGWSLVPLLHDMIPLHDYFSHRQKDFPTNFIGDNRFVVENSDLVVANSEFTKSEIQDFIEKKELPEVDALVAIPLVHECAEGTEPSESSPPEAPYLLTVGATTGRKNLELVFEAMLQLHEADKPVPRVCLAGALRKRTQQYFEQPRFEPIRDKIEIRHNPNQTDLVTLYENALALVIPSRMEGWGLPAGEALWLGTPSLCSTAPVFREVCGDLGLYFDPDKPEELVAHIDRLMSDEAYLRVLRDRIAASKSELRDWSHVAGDLVDALRAEFETP